VGADDRVTASTVRPLGEAVMPLDVVLGDLATPWQITGLMNENLEEGTMRTLIRSGASVAFTLVVGASLITPNDGIAK